MTTSTLLAAAILAAVVTIPQGDHPVRGKFVDLAAKKDHRALVEHWRANPDETLGAIDEDLEGFLALVEKNGEPAKIQEMKDRAIFGARAADEAFGRTIFGEYASSYAGWNAAQQKKFREGQSASGEAGKAIRVKDFARAKNEAQRCIDCARPLGDWWGASSGYSSLGTAEEGLGNDAAAIDAYQMARVLHHDLNFFSNELRDTVALARLTVRAGAYVRAEMMIEQGMRLAESRKQPKASAELAELKKKLDAEAKK